MPSPNLNYLSSRLVYSQEDIVHLIKGPNNAIDGEEYNNSYLTLSLVTYPLTTLVSKTKVRNGSEYCQYLLGEC